MIKLKTKTVEYIDDARGLDRPDWTFLITAAIYECLDKTSDAGIISTMWGFRNHIICDWTMRCNPNDCSMTITTEDGHIDILPTINEDGLEVFFFDNVDDSPIYSTIFSIDDLIDNDVIV